MNNNNNNILSKKKFAESMEFLNAYYVHFKLDLDNELVIRVWYDMLKSFDDYTLEKVVSDYAKHNVYPPSSPASLIEWFNKLHKTYIEDLKNDLIDVLRLNEYVVLREDGEEVYATNYEKALGATADPIIKHLIIARKNGKLDSIHKLEKYLKENATPSLNYKEIKLIDLVKKEE